MTLRDFPSWLRDTTLRTFPHPTRPGLRRIGNPGAEDPVLLTGNFALTVRRVTNVLAGRNAWLLVANSHGINVWCASTGGHLTDHDVIAVLRSSGIDSRVSHRRLVLPQLAATGIEHRRIHEATGWEARWGPARLEDLPAFLDHGAHVTRRQRFMTFPAWERLEMGLMWGAPVALLVAIGVGLTGGVPAALLTVGVLLLAVLALFLAVPWLPVGSPPARWAICAGLAVASFAVIAGALWRLQVLTPGALMSAGVAVGLCMAVFGLDLTGSTPWWPGGVNTLGNRFEVELLTDRCIGAGDCVLVCPRDVFEMNGSRRKVEIVRPDDCVRCGACIVQCPEDALRFRYADGRVVEAPVVRRTRMNMLGRRTVELTPPPQKN